MNRRSFFRTMIGGIAASAAVRTWPFRVYSFPSQIVIPHIAPPRMLSSCYGGEALAAIQAGNFDEFVKRFISKYLDNCVPYSHDERLVSRS